MGYRQLKFSEGTRFLVTGGAGFIGSNLSEAILNLGYQVVCLDNLSTGKMENIEALMNHPHYKFIKGDIRDFDMCMRSCEGVDYVLHEAALGSVPGSIEEPLEYDQVNAGGTLQMMEAARQQKVKRFVYASSSAVYGDCDVVPNKEGQEAQVLSPYALQKKICEEYGRLYTNLYGLPTYGLRYFNVFGKRQDPEGAYAAVIPKFIKILLEGNAPKINGDGLQTRDFTFVENVVEANLKACQAPEKCAGEAFNIAYGAEETLIHVYDVLCAALHMDIRPEFGPERTGDIKFSNADISKARRLLGYDPDYDFETGLQMAIKWYRENL